MTFDPIETYRQILHFTGADEGSLRARIVRVALRAPWVFYRRLASDRAFVRAAGMAYATLVALVPMLVLVYALVAATARVDPNAVTSMLFGSFIGAVPEVSGFLLPGLQKVSLSALSATGVLMLLLVGARLFLMVEAAYCDIFGVPVDRPFGQRLLYFYVTATAVPVVLGITLAHTLDVMGGSTHARELLASALQFVVLVAALKLFPSTTVRWMPALVGATVTWVLCSIGGRVFQWYLVWFVSDDPLRMLYGAVGLVPVFLIWLYVVWIFVLLGVEVANVLQNYKSLVEAELAQLEADRRPVRALTIAPALQVAAHVAWHFHLGRGPLDVEELATRTGLRGKEVHAIARVLVSIGSLVRTEAGWLPARPPEDIAVSDLVRAWQDHTAVVGHDLSLAQDVDDALARAFTGSLADAAERWVGRSDPVGRSADQNGSTTRLGASTV